jgi:hypothetical protein
MALRHLTVRAGDREIGKLVGFITEDGGYRICSLVLESGGSFVAMPMLPVQFDAASRSLRIVQSSDDDYDIEVTSDSLPVVAEVAEEDLWVPFIHSAA